MSAILPIGEAIIGNIGSITKAAEAGSPDMGEAFGEQMIKALDNVEATQDRSDGAAQLAATGDLQSVSDYMVASTEANLVMQLTVAVRNKAVEAFNDIMRMPV